MKNVNPDSIDKHLKLNGGRLLHPSRKFWRNHGRPVATVREAVRLVQFQKLRRS